MKAKISDKNSKLGKIMNVSLPPVTTCRPGAPCAKDCYAMKAWHMYPSVRKAWSHNLDCVKVNWGKFFDSIIEQINGKKNTPRFFRWHVSGDILDKEYFAGMIDVARRCPDTIFLAFTKRYNIVNDMTDHIPENLTIIFSAWPGLEMENQNHFPVAWFDDGTDNRIPEDCIECPGLCDSCGMCFQLGRIGKDVRFKKH